MACFFLQYWLDTSIESENRRGISRMQNDTPRPILNKRIT
ncbi:hypothetical protein BIFANG_02466 [Bifidobacterium angulatum DSM 20098 = JCM 7096]|uniref:Uncharacterized protein n=1 Tax=Bifidobacterium angulatum DSM 20098 = JCM 7096 TaxID=518635 RepID=C4FDS9_9BIFI|nr:hypothetical protein BIFANG_02466 [Bifidobacterium angulatum DSM 20098 = JCM 7096]